MGEIELKPCERCGNTPERHEYHVSEDGDWAHMDCGCGGGAVFIRGRDVDDCIPELIEAWNTRTPSDTGGAAVDKAAAWDAACATPPKDSKRITELEASIEQLIMLTDWGIDRLIMRADGDWAGKIQGGGREWNRAIGGAFAEYEKIARSYRGQNDVTAKELRREARDDEAFIAGENQVADLQATVDRLEGERARMETVLSGTNEQLTEQFDLSTKYVALHQTAETRLSTIRQETIEECAKLADEATARWCSESVHAEQDGDFDSAAKYELVRNELSSLHKAILAAPPQEGE